MYHMERITRRSEAIDKVHLAEVLREWLATSTASTIGDITRFRGRYWLTITDDRRYYHLNADTTREGVSSYLSLAERHGEALDWSVERTPQGNYTKVLFGPRKEKLPGFFLYAHTR